MGVYINGMEMPEHCGYCRFRYDGICHALQKTQYNKEDGPLIPVPPHGRLIDADALCAGRVSNDNVVICATVAPTIIPAEEVYARWHDTAGNYHWTGTQSGEHLFPAEEGEE